MPLRNWRKMENSSANASRSNPLRGWERIGSPASLHILRGAAFFFAHMAVTAFSLSAVYHDQGRLTNTILKDLNTADSNNINQPAKAFSTWRGICAILRKNDGACLR